MEYMKLNEARIGDTFERPLLVSAIAENMAKSGKPFVRITLKDGSAEQTAAMFDTTKADLEARGITKESIVDAQLSVTEYQGAKSFKLLSIAPTADPTLTIADFVKGPPLDPDMMFDEICALLTSAADDRGGRCRPLSDLALHILQDHRSAYMTSSAAVSVHHNFWGGLLYHSYRMVKAADALCGVYQGLDRELLLCGTALHDIGKLWEYHTSAAGDAEFTVSGVLFGHLYMGASLIKGYTRDQQYDREKVQLLIHLILSHHGTQEFGAVACPAIPEAFVLHYVDNIDAKVYMCEHFYEELAPGELTEKRPFGLDNRIYRPDR